VLLVFTVNLNERRWERDLSGLQVILKAEVLKMVVMRMVFQEHARKDRF
jgi:hypothetical protein